MKKKQLGRYYLIYLQKTLRIMRLSLFLIILSTAMAHSAASYSQNTKLSLELNNVTVREVIKTIESQSEFLFFFQEKHVDLNRKVSLNVKDQDVESILTQVFDGTDNVFFINNRQIIIGLANPKIPSIPNQKLYEQSTPEIEQPSQRPVNGKVNDENGQPLPGVTVLVKGTTIGTITNSNGEFTLNIPPTAQILQFSFVGMMQQELPIGNSTTFNIIMEEETVGLEEVVAVGYGTMKKRDVTGSVGSVRSEFIEQIKPTQTASALQGQVAGVNVKKVNSRPGSDYTIDIRGVHSISFSSEPLVVIDGVMGGKLNTLNPSDIESMDVLKDASATAIYGARGANGVIIIATKKGVEGKTKVTYDGYVGVKSPQVPELMTAQQFYRAYNDVVKAENPNANIIWTQQQQENVDAGRTVNWVDEITDPAIQTNHVVSLSGGNENTTHYFSTGYLNEKGTILNTGYERVNLKGSIDSKLNDFLKVGFNSYYTYSLLNTGSKEALRSAYRARPTGSIFFNDLVNPTETNDWSYKGYAVWMGINDTQVPNPRMEVEPEIQKEETRVSSFLGNGYLEVTLLKGLTFKSSLAANVFSSRFGDFRNINSKARLSRPPTAATTWDVNSSYTLDNILTFQKESENHNLNITVAQSALKERFESSSTSVENLPYYSIWYALQTASQITGVSSRLIERSILSYMGRMNYSFNDRYLLTLTGRYDGSSVLAEGNKWAFFPSVALGWRAGEETFIKNLNLFSDLKFRLSYGEVGNDVVPPYSTQAFLNQTAYDFDGTAAYGYAPNSIGNANLRWENSAEINVGIDLGFLKNRIMASLEFYDKKTNDLIQNVALPTSLGFDAVTANVGKIRNKGFEMMLNTVNIQRNNLRWATNINFSTNHNEILELYGGEVTRDIANSLFVGESLLSHYYYEFDGIWQLDEADEAAKYNQVPGSVKVVDQNNDDKISSNINEDDRVILGNELPKWMAGINNTINFYNWDFSAFIYTRQGVMYRNSLLSGTMGELGSNRYNRLNLNYWTEENPTNDYFGVWQPNPYRQAIQYMEANFWRISNITLGYSFSNAVLDRLNFSKIRFYVQANNPFVFVKDRILWMDPEYNSGTYQDDLPYSTYIFGVNVSF